MHLVEIAFNGNRKEFFVWDGEEPPRPQTPVVVEGDRGEDLGRVHATGELAAKRYAGVAHGEAQAGLGVQPTQRALRVASVEEVARGADLAEQNELARRKIMERVRAHALVMKVSDCEWQWDRRKLTVYFTAERRVDFRALVRDLAAHFRTRIELKQIGVRDEAKRLTGVGRCGREYCSAAWLPELRPVNLSVAKDQRLSLNPTQISGACGRLMCSLRYEHEFYVQQRKRFPKEGKVLATARGEEKVVANDIFRERVTLRAFDGETRVVPLADLRRELEDLASGVSTPAGEMLRGDGESGPDAPHDDAPRDRSAGDDAGELPDDRRRRRTTEAASAAEAAGEPAAERRMATHERRGGGDRRDEPVALPSLRERVPSATADAGTPEARETPDGRVPAQPIAGDAAGGRARAEAGLRAPDEENEGDDFEGANGASDESGDAGVDGGGDGSAVDADGVPRPRRRRGRRGGRRNRGSRAGSPDADAAAEGEGDRDRDTGAPPTGDAP